MIRKVLPQDTEAIANIYNEYVTKSVVTFETIPLTVNEMGKRIDDLSKEYPYFIYELDGEIIGYCYAHAWKARAAYKNTLETTVYISAKHKSKGIGTQLMNTLISHCKELGYHTLIACITAGNDESNRLHSRLGFKQVSHYKEVGKKFDKWLDVIDYQLML